jgi:hypothetical protein
VAVVSSNAYNPIRASVKPDAAVPVPDAIVIDDTVIVVAGVKNVIQTVPLVMATVCMPASPRGNMSSAEDDWFADAATVAYVAIAELSRASANVPDVICDAASVNASLPPLPWLAAWPGTLATSDHA